MTIKSEYQALTNNGFKKKMGASLLLPMNLNLRLVVRLIFVDVPLFSYFHHWNIMPALPRWCFYLTVALNVSQESRISSGGSSAVKAEEDQTPA